MLGVPGGDLRQVVAHPVALGAQVFDVVRVRRDLERLVCVHVHAEAGQAFALVRVVGQQAGGDNPQVP